jgi:hypothetical protein
MTTWWSFVALVMVLSVSVPTARADGSAGARAALEVGIGTQGILSYEELGVRLPVGSRGSPSRPRRGS